MADTTVIVWQDSTQQDQSRMIPIDHHCSRVAGGGDATVVVWLDSTQQDAAAAAEEEDLVFEREQALSNALAVSVCCVFV